MGLILPLLRAVPLWLYAVAGLFAWGAYGHWEANRYEKARQESIQEAQRLQNQAEAHSQIAAQKVDADYEQKIQAVNGNVAKLRSSNDKLQQLLHKASDPAKSSTAICGLDGERGNRLESLLSEGANVATEGSERVESLTAKVTGLQNYITNVCLGK